MDGRPVSASPELIVAVRSRAVGETITLTVRRGSEELEVPVVLDQTATD